MTAPTPEQVLERLADFIDAARAWSNERRKAEPDLEVQQTYWRLHHDLQFNLGTTQLRQQATQLRQQQEQLRAAEGELGRV